MKNTIRLIGIIAMIAVIGLLMAACKGDDDTPIIAATKAVYRGMDSAANVYELAISKAPGRAAYDPVAGDDYVLTVTPPEGSGTSKTSEGAVKDSVDGGFVLTPKGAAKSFNVAVDGEYMIAIAGDVAYTNGSTETARATGLLPPTAGGDTTISSNTFVSGATVVYDSRIGGPKANGTSLAGAKAVTSFNYALSGDNDESLAGEEIANIAPGSSVTISGGKLTAIWGAPTVPLQGFDTPNFNGLEITPSDSHYFGEPDRPVVMVNIGGPIDVETVSGLYGLICAQSDTSYASIVYVDKDTKVKGSDEHDGITDILDIDVKAGWNYVFISKVGKFNIFTASKRLPASYKWTVIDMNFPLDLGGDGDGDHDH